MNKIQQIEQQQLWMSRINDLASSGLTQSQWCQEKGFSVSTLRYWMRKLREPEEQDSTNWLQVDIPEDGHVVNVNEFLYPLSGEQPFFDMDLFKPLRSILSIHPGHR